MRWKALRPLDFSRSIRLPQVSACDIKAKELQAAELSNGLEEIDPMALATKLMEEDSSLTVREVRAIPSVSLDPRCADLGPDLLRKVIQTGQSRKSFWKRFFQAWAFHYPVSNDRAELARRALTEHQSDLSDSQKVVINELRVLQGLDPEWLTEKILGENSAETRKALALEDGFPRTGLATVVLSLVAYHLSVSKPALSQVEQFYDLIVHKESIHESVKAYAMIGLLKPLENRSPEEKFVKTVSKVFQKEFSDPRVGDRDWPSIPDGLGGEKSRKECLEIAKRWTVFESILFFFKIIEDVVDRKDAKHHFPKRKDFWLKYFRNKAVTEAWVLLGSKALARVEALARSGDEELALLEYASMRGASHDQCALLLRVGDLTILEWSHSGACRVWNHKDRRAPWLNRKTYNRSEIMRDVVKPSHKIVHDANDRWVRKLHTVLRDEGGVRSVV